MSITIASGTGNDTQAFNTAAFGRRGEIIAPAGEWHISGLKWTGDKITLRGEGPGATIIYVHRTNTSPPVEAIRMIGNDLAIKDLEFREAAPVATRQERVAVPGMTGIRIGGYPKSGGNFWASRATVENVVCRDITGQGIVGYYADDLRIKDCDVFNVGEGIAGENCRSRVRINGCTAIGSADDLIIIKAANDNGALATQYGEITNCIVSDGDAEGIEMSGCDYFHCTDNKVGPVNQHGIGVYGDWFYPALYSPSRGIVDRNIVTGAGKWYGTDPAKYKYTAPNASATSYSIKGRDIWVGTNLAFDSLGQSIPTNLWAPQS